MYEYICIPTVQRPLIPRKAAYADFLLMLRVARDLSRVEIRK